MVIHVVVSDRVRDQANTVVAAANSGTAFDAPLKKGQATYWWAKWDLDALPEATAANKETRERAAALLGESVRTPQKWDVRDVLRGVFPFTVDGDGAYRSSNLSVYVGWDPADVLADVGAVPDD